MAAGSIMASEHRFVKALAGALRHRCGVRAGARLLVAVSGGADSVALLRALAILAPRRGWGLDLAVGHVQHHLRGRAAEDDAQFVAALAAEWRLPYLRADLNLDDVRHAAGGGNLEARARRARYQALVTMAASVDAPFIVTAHQADDQLETVLMRLLRGASVRGLAGMAYRRALRGGDGPGEAADALTSYRSFALIRPMLAVTRADARQFLADLGQAWCEDHTNQDRSRLRARLRADVLPALQAAAGDAAPRAVALGEHLRQVARLLDEAVGRAADQVVREGNVLVLDRVAARALPRVVLVGLLRRLLHEQGVPADRLGSRCLGPIVRAVGDSAGGRRGFDLPQGVHVQVERAAVRIARD